MTLTSTQAYVIAGVVTMITTPWIESAVHIVPRSVLGFALDIVMWLALAVVLRVTMGERR